MSRQAHLFVALVTLLSVGFVIHLVRRRRVRPKYAMLWTSVCGVILVAAIVPDLANRSASAVGISYQPAAFLFVAVAFLFLVVVHFSYELSKLEDRSQVLAEEVALLREQLERSGPERVSAPSGT